MKNCRARRKFIEYSKKVLEIKKNLEKIPKLPKNDKL